MSFETHVFYCNTESTERIKW